MGKPSRSFHERVVDGCAEIQRFAKQRWALWYCLWELPDAVRAVALASLAGSFLCAVAPLYWPLCWLNGGFGDSIIMVAITGTIGLFFSAVGLAGERLRHPGYVHAFFVYLLARMLAITGVFVADRYNLERCEMYGNSLTNRIYPNITLHRLANQESGWLFGCAGARNYLTARWIADVLVSLYTLYCVHTRYDALHSAGLTNDVFEDPVDVFARWRDQKDASLKADAQARALHGPEPAALPAAAPRLTRVSAAGLATLERVFRALDRNGDGQVSRIEFIQAVRQDPTVAAYFGFAHGIHQEDGSRATFERLFQHLDTHSHRAFTLEELRHWASAKADARAQWAKARSAVLFAPPRGADFVPSPHPHAPFFVPSPASPSGRAPTA